jgi:hypothetical protein
MNKKYEDSLKCFTISFFSMIFILIIIKCLEN